VYHEGSRYVIHQVILPVPDEGAAAAGQTGLPLTGAKLCPACGYLHPIAGGDPGPNTCEQCGVQLTFAVPNLFRMQNVVTKRRDRINSDEEERVRMGYDLRTGVRFAERHDRPGQRNALVEAPLAGAQSGQAPGLPLRLTYGDAATLWRINMGWKRRRSDSLPGFVLVGRLVRRQPFCPARPADRERIGLPDGRPSGPRLDGVAAPQGLPCRSRMGSTLWRAWLGARPSFQSPHPLGVGNGK